MAYERASRRLARAERDLGTAEAKLVASRQWVPCVGQTERQIEAAREHLQVRVSDLLLRVAARSRVLRDLEALGNGGER